MNIKLLNCIQSLQKPGGFRTKLGFNIGNVFLYIDNLAWGILLCILLSIMAHVSFYILLSLTVFFHVVGTGLYSYKVPYMDLKKVNLSDFQSIDLSLAETEIILAAQKKGMNYKDFFANISNVGTGFFVI